MAIKMMITASLLNNCFLYLLLATLLAAPAYADGKIDPSIHLRGVVLPSEQVKVAFSQGGLLLEMLGNGKSAAKGEKIGRAHV